MVDVMLVLLIIFMVITPYVDQGRSRWTMVKAKNPIAMKDADKEDAILIAVTRDGEVFLSPGNKQVTLDELPGKVQRSADEQAGQDRVRQGRRALQVRAGGGRGRQPARGGRGSVGLITEQIRGTTTSTAATPAQ